MLTSIEAAAADVVHRVEDGRCRARRVRQNTGSGRWMMAVAVEETWEACRANRLMADGRLIWVRGAGTWSLFRFLSCRWRTAFVCILS